MDPELENTGTRESRRADEAMVTSEHDIIRSAVVLSDFQRTMGTFRDLYERNGFGENLKQLMMAPARKAS